MKNILMLILFVSFPIWADSNLGTDLPIRKGSMMTIKSYDPATRTYTVFATAFPGEGDSKVTLEGLKKALPELDFDRAKKFPKSIVGRDLKLDGDLPTLFDEEVEARKGGKSKALKKKPAVIEDSVPTETTR